MKQFWLGLSCLSLTFLWSSGCTSAPEVKTQAYAQLRDHLTFEEDFPTVWKAIESSLRLARITAKDPAEATPLEMKKLNRRSLQTDWIFSKSKHKYVEFQVNGFPKKTYLQNRYKYQVLAERTWGGIQVRVISTEEVQRLTETGAPSDYERSGDPDSFLASDLIEKIKLELNSAPSI